MSDQEIFEKVKEIVVNQLGVDENLVKEDATFIDDLSADSLDIVELVMSLEEAFEMEIPDTEAEKIVTVGDVVQYIKDNK
ncbi:MAG: acyl carrier protein [Clostridia bacterium]|nr:acyl carrier protein [Clostridia bacterium]